LQGGCSFFISWVATSLSRKSLLRDAM
jgi:hypothetical protein